jgi:cbb3-type cytochrome oxidase subunit 3
MNKIIIFKITNYSLLLFTLFALFLFSAPQISSAEGESSFKKSLDATANATGHKSSAGLSADLPTTIGKIISLVLSFIGVIFLILMIYAGYIWMLARGNEQQIEKARNIILSSIIGLIIVLCAYAVTFFFMSNIGARLIGNGTASSGSSDSNPDLCQLCQSGGGSPVDCASVCN